MELVVVMGDVITEPSIPLRGLTVNIQSIELLGVYFLVESTLEINVRRNNRINAVILQWAAVLFISLAALLIIIQLVTFSRVRSSFPPGMVIAGVPVGGLNQQQAADRLVQAYSLPVEIRYGDAIIQIKPAVIGFELDLEAMLAAADLQRVNQSFWDAFWEYLWNRVPRAGEIPLRFRFSQERLRTYLNNEIASRYDQPPTQSMPVPGSTSFQPGASGVTLDVNRAVVLIEDALRSPSARVVNLTYSKVAPPRPSLQNLQVLLKQILDLSKFEGLTELYLQDMQTNQELHFAYQGGKTIKPNVAFTAASTIKIPIMVSVFRRTVEPTPTAVALNLAKMIEFSENESSDKLMETVLDKATGPLEVTKDLQTLGLKNTFLAGYFYPGAPLLKRFTTTANARQDVKTDPDIYNQTTPAEIGMLLGDIYQCAETGGGTFAAVFPGEITQSECRQMINYLTLNRMPMLTAAGLPEGVQIAHKHGWVTELDGLLHSMADAGIIYTPGGNYILTVFLHQTTQLVFDPANLMIAELSRAVYNYFNPPAIP